MKNRAPIQDAIDRRNFKQELASTVIKRSRVRFVMKEDENLDEEEEILERILAENELYDDSFNNEFEDDGYGLVEEPDLDMSGISEDVMSVADEIFARLQREAEEDNEARKLEWMQRLANEEM